MGIGVIPSLEQWEKDLQAIKLPFKMPGEKNNVLIRLGIAKVQLYKVMFPEEHLDAVMNMLGVSDTVTNRYPVIKKIVKRLRKILGLQELPQPKKRVLHMQPYAAGKAVTIIPLGSKKDLFTKDGMELI